MGRRDSARVSPRSDRPPPRRRAGPPGRLALAAVDLDGTLLDASKRISGPDQAAIARAERAGIPVAIISGRRFAELEELIADAPAASFRAGHGGALIAGPGEFRLETPLPRDVAAAASAAGARMGLITLVSDRDGGVRIHASNPANPRVRRYFATVRPRPRFEPALRFPEDPLHVVLAGTPEQCRAAEKVVRDASGVGVTLERTEYPGLGGVGLGLLDVLAAATDKGVALARIAAEAGVALADTLAIGDNWNDLSMLRAAGVGVLMANAAPELRELGFAATASNEESGVAAAFERFLFRPPGPS